MCRYGHGQHNSIESSWTPCLIFCFWLQRIDNKPRIGLTQAWASDHKTCLCSGLPTYIFWEVGCAEPMPKAMFVQLVTAVSDSGTFTLLPFFAQQTSPTIVQKDDLVWTCQPLHLKNCFQQGHCVLFLWRGGSCYCFYVFPTWCRKATMQLHSDATN